MMHVAILALTILSFSVHFTATGAVHATPKIAYPKIVYTVAVGLLEPDPASSASYAEHLPHSVEEAATSSFLQFLSDYPSALPQPSLLHSVDVMYQDRVQSIQASSCSGLNSYDLLEVSVQFLTKGAAKTMFEIMSASETAAAKLVSKFSSVHVGTFCMPVEALYQPCDKLLRSTQRVSATQCFSLKPLRIAHVLRRMSKATLTREGLIPARYARCVRSRRQP